MNKATKWMLAIGVAGMLTGLATAANAETSANTEQAQTQVQDNHQRGDKKFGNRAGYGLGQSQELLTLLKLDQAALQEQLKAGKSLAQVAEAQGVTREQLIAQLQQQQEAHLAEEVQDGKLTQEQADSKKAQLAGRLAEQVDRTFDPNAVQGGRGMDGKGGKLFGLFGKDGAQDTELLALLKLDAAGLQEQLKAGKSLAEVAEAQGVTREQLIAHLQQKQAAQLAQAVTDGKLTQEQADNMQTNAADKIGAQVDRKFDPTAAQVGKGGKHGGQFGKGFGQDAELLTLLKLDAAGLQEQLKAGKSLAEIAEAQGVTREQLIAHLQQKQEAQLAQAVTDGKLTQEQADSMKARSAAMIDAQVDRKFDASAKQNRKQTGVAPTNSSQQPAQSTTTL